MGIGKYLTNLGVIGALIGALGTLRQTQQMPKDWRRYLVWAVWAAGLALAIGSVSKQPDDEAYEAEMKAQQKVLKEQAKLARKQR